MVDTKKTADGVEKSKAEDSTTKGKDGKKKDAPAANKSALSEKDIKLLETYQTGPYDKLITETDEKIKKVAKNIGKLRGVKESDLGLSQPQYWDLAGDEKLLGGKSSLHVARCTKIINEGTDDASYMVKIKQMATYVVELGEELSPLDVEAGMRVGCDRGKYSIQLPLPPRIDATVSLMTVEDRPDVTYDDIGGCKEQLEKLREVVELPLLHPERYTDLGIDPPKGVLLFGPPGTGKTLTARAVANRTEATFIRVNGSELLQRYVGEGARLVRELFNMARSKKACVIFFDEIDAVGGTRFGGEGGDNEVQRTMLELITQLDGFDSRGNIKVLMATNRPDTLDPALLRPGRLDRKIEFGLPDLAGRIHIMRIHARSMSVDSNIRWEMLAQRCPQSTGADLQAVSTEAGMLAIRDRRKLATEADYLEAIQKVIKDQRKFHANKKYMIHN